MADRPRPPAGRIVLLVPGALGTKVGIVAAVVVLAVLGWLALRHGQDTRSAIALATVSGLAYGGAALAARLLASGDGTPTSPATGCCTCSPTRCCTR
jgi:hypothetical protein